MADTPQLTIEIQLDDGSVKKGIARLPDQFKPAGRASGEEMASGIENGLKDKLGSIKTMMLGFAATITAGLTVGKMISEASEEEDAVNSLGAALRQTNRYTNDILESLNNFAGKMQETTRFSDDAVLSGMALLQTLTNLDENGLKRATVAAADLASGLRIDLQTAMMLIGKAAEGEIGTFGRYGMKIQEGKTNAETFANTLRAIEGKMGGRSVAELNTFAGGIDHLKNSFNNLLGEMGKYIIKAPIISASSKEISRIISEATGSVSKKTGDQSALFGMSRSLLNVAEACTYVSYGFEAIWNAAKIAFEFVNYSASIAWGAIVQVANGISKILPKDSELRQSIENMAASAEATTQDRLKALGDAAGNAFNFGFSNSAMKSIENIRANIDAEELRINSIKNDLGNNTGPALEIGQPKNVTNEMKWMDDLVAKSEDMKKKMVADAKAINQAISQGLAHGISGGVQNIVTSIMNGQNAFANFGKFVLACMGDMSIRLGEMFIAQGLAIDAFKALEGGVAIAAGISLVALGTIMKSWSGPMTAGASTANGGVTPTYADSSGNGGASPVSNEAKKEESKTSVAVHIYGDVHDGEASGLRFVELIQNAIDKNGAKLSLA